MPTRVLIPSGALGLGFDRAALDAGLLRDPDIICIDGGSTDSGPFYLGTGTSKYSRGSTKAEWRDLMIARAKAGVPLLIGTAGTCGTNSTVDWMYDITCEIAAELGQTLSIARLYSSQDPSQIADAFARGQINALEPRQPLDAELIDTCSNIVALAGAEQIQACLNAGADIVLAGRTTDTAIIAALPLQNGDSAGGAWHRAKIGECGAYCSSNPTSGVILIDFDADGFTVEPLARDTVCTPQSVSAHMLYENADPLILYEPGGHLDVTDAQYTQLDAGRVRVSGSKWITSDAYTVKLEGSRITGHQAVVMATIREAKYVARAQEWANSLLATLCPDIERKLDLTPQDYSFEIRLIGMNATLGQLETRTDLPVEVGIMGIATAPSAALADEMVKLANPLFLHHPLTADEPQVTFAFPFSPASMDRGPLYEFCLNHVVTLGDPMDAFDLQLDTVRHG